MQFVAELLDANRAFIGSREITVHWRGFAPKFHRDVRDHDAVFLPQLFDLALAFVQESIEVMHEQDAFARGIRRATPANQHVVGALGGREAFSQKPFRNDLEARKLSGLKRQCVHRIDATMCGKCGHRNRDRKLTNLASEIIGCSKGPD
jgi:hypothetical protein